MAIWERLKQESVYGRSAKKSGRYREVAIVETWLLVKLWLYQLPSPEIQDFSSLHHFLSGNFHGSQMLLQFSVAAVIVLRLYSIVFAP